MLELYDRVLGSRSMDTLVGITVIVTFMFIILWLLQFVQSNILIRVGSRLDKSLNNRIFNAIFQKSLRQPGVDIGQAISDLTSIRQFLTGQGILAFFELPWSPLYLVILFWAHPLMGTFALIAAALSFGLMLINEFATKKPLDEANQKAVVSRNYASQNLRNAEIIHALGMEENIRKKWLQGHFAFLSKQAEASEKASVFSHLSRVIRTMAQSFILGLGCYLALKNEVSPGMMIAGSIIMGRALAPLDMIISTWKLFSAARMSYKRVSDLLAEAPPLKRYMTLPPPKGNVSIEGIIVQPPGSNTSVLKSVSFAVNGGESVGIIGPSASGKSTLARAILGIWQPMVGKVRLDGADINQLNRDEIGQYLGYLPQDIELFDGTISENIARFGEIVPAKVIKAAQLAGVHEMILNLPAGYDTRIGMGGSVLSAGQRQRIAFARALYGDPKIIVLDEPNSNLDDQGEFALAMAINTLKQAGTTIFLITHRPGILARMDKILFLKDGLVAAFGPRDAVLQALSAKANVQQQSTQKPVLKQVAPH